MLKQKNSRIQGNVGIGVAISYFCKQGYYVSIPLTDSQRYDLVVDIDGVLNRVQVKTTYFKAPSGCYQVALKTCGGNRSGNTIKNFDPSGVDYLFVVTNDNDQYLIPCRGDMPKTCICLNQGCEQFRVV